MSLDVLENEISRVLGSHWGDMKKHEIFEVASLLIDVCTSMLYEISSLPHYPCQGSCG